MTTPPTTARVTLSRAKGWKMPPNTRVVTRGTVFGNPWQIGDPGIWRVPRENEKAGWSARCKMDVVVANYDAVALFSAWLRNDLIPFMPDTLSDREQDVVFERMRGRRAAIVNRLPELRGKNLACTCKPGQGCHADVLLELANA